MDKFLLKWRTSTSNEMFRPRRWNYCKLNTAKLTALAKKLNWSETTRADSVEIQWANIKNVVLSLRDKTVPLVPAKKSSPTPWLRRKHKRAKARKGRAYAILMKTNTPAHLAVFKKEAANLHLVRKSTDVGIIQVTQTLFCLR